MIDIVPRNVMNSDADCKDNSYKYDCGDSSYNCVGNIGAGHQDSSDMYVSDTDHQDSSHRRVRVRALITKTVPTSVSESGH